MAGNKKKKIDLGNMDSLSHNPFAALGGKFGVTPQANNDPEPPPQEAESLEQPMLLVRMEKRKKGKVATCIYHVKSDHRALLKKLKQKLGSGGTLDDDVLELQGDHRKTLPGFLEAEGFKVRLGN